MKIQIALLLGGMLAAIGACDQPDPIGPGQSYLRAEITGAVVKSYSGTATFYSRFHNRIEKDLITVLSYDTSASSAWPEQRIRFMGIGHRSITGLVDLDNLDPGMPDTSGFTAVHVTSDQRYVSANGTLTTERSTGDVIEASFSFDAFRYCIDREPGEHCPIPEEPPANTDWITVEGNFVARADADSVPQLDR